MDGQHGAAVQALLHSRDDLSIVPIAEVEARYIADGQVVKPEEERPLLIPAQDAWLSDVLLVVLDLQSSQFVRVTEQTLRRSAEKLRRVRVWWASKIDVEINGEVVDLPSHSGRSIALDDADHPMLIATSSSQGLSWEILESLSTPLAEIAGNRATAREIALACVRLGGVYWVERGESPAQPKSPRCSSFPSRGSRLPWRASGRTLRRRSST